MKRVPGSTFFFPIAALILLAGCGSEEASAASKSVNEQIQEMSAQQRDGGNSSQAEILADGEVSDAEFRQAVSDARECMIAEGLEVTEIEKELTLEAYTLSFSFEPGARSPEETFDIADKCEDSHSMAVRTAWSLQTAQQLSPAGKVLLEACYSEKGIKFPEVSSLEELRVKTPKDSLDIWGRCIDESLDRINE